MTHLQRPAPNPQKARLLPTPLLTRLAIPRNIIIPHPPFHIPQQCRNEIHPPHAFEFVLEIRRVLVGEGVDFEEFGVRRDIRSFDLFLGGNSRVGIDIVGIDIGLPFLQLFLAFAREEFAGVENAVDFGGDSSFVDSDGFGGVGDGEAGFGGGGGDAFVVFEFLGDEGGEIVGVVHHSFLGEHLGGEGFGAGGSFDFVFGGGSGGGWRVGSDFFTFATLLFASAGIIVIFG